MTNNTVSLGVAKKLKEAGWSKECLHNKREMGVVGHTPDGRTISKVVGIYEMPQMHEILDELPETVAKEGINYWLRMDRTSGLHNFHYIDEPTDNQLGTQFEFNPHDACALLYIWCKENKYI